ncbi:hypothetical protein THAOC_29805, partial [Thalassiosira oceanica]
MKLTRLPEAPGKHRFSDFAAGSSATPRTHPMPNVASFRAAMLVVIKALPALSCRVNFVIFSPVPTQASNDSGLGARTDVLGEVKTLQPSKNSYDKGNCQTNSPVNLRATQAVRSYRRRAAGLDQKYAQEVVGDGTNGQVGPFETALGEFYTGNVLPVA